ncbi:hypothetical protein [Flavobacterium croceum]|nr:hypothetical protein [Flavobacterium croceum]
MTKLNYNLIKNLFLVEDLKELKSNMLISDIQYSKAVQDFVITKTNTNILVRIGFFLLGLFLLSSLFGILSLFIFAGFTESNESYKAMLFVYAVICYGASEIAYRNNYFAFGFDDSFVMGAHLFTALSFGIYTESVAFGLLVYSLSGIFCVVRYVHTPSVFLTMLGVVSFISYLVLEEKLLNPFLLPILLVLVSVLFLWLYFVFTKKESGYLYQNVLHVVKYSSVLIAYVSINYYTVREVAISFMNLEIKPNSDIPFAILFYVLTFLIPIMIFYWALKTKDRYMLWISVFCFALSVLTIRYYYAVLEPEYALILAGVVLFSIAYILIQKIKNNRKGFTFLPDKSINPMTFDVLKNILLLHQIDTTTTLKQESPMEFGGGGFSGGGSGESY